MRCVFPVILAGCSVGLAPVPGDKCADYDRLEWSEYDKRFAEEWACLTGGDAGEIEESVASLNVVCIPESLQTRCYFDDAMTRENLEMRVSGFHPDSCGELFPGVVTGMFDTVTETVFISTRIGSDYPKFPLTQTSAGHEYQHYRFGVETGDPDSNHSGQGGPWLPIHDRFDDDMKAGESPCVTRRPPA